MRTREEPKWDRVNFTGVSSLLWCGLGGLVPNLAHAVIVTQQARVNAPMSLSEACHKYYPQPYKLDGQHY